MKDALAIHAIKTLPDSITQRRELLQAVIHSTDKNSEVRTTAVMLLRLLTEHERAQLEFILPKGGRA